MSVEPDAVTEIRRIYEETLEKKKKVDEDIRVLAYYIGKLNGLVNSLRVMEKIGQQIEEEITRAAMQGLEAKRVFLDELPERKPEDYEKFSREVERVNERLRAQKEVIKRMVDAFKARVEAEASKVREEIKSGRMKEPD